MTFLITDDEAVAMAVGAGVAWQALLPTVDSADAVELVTAAARGERSIVVRGLDEHESDGFALARRATQARLLALAYSARDDSVLTPRAGGIALFADAPDTVIIDFTSATGIHDLAVVSEREAITILKNVMLGAPSTEVTEANRCFTIVNAPQNDEPQRALVATAHSTTAHVISTGALEAVAADSGSRVPSPDLWLSNLQKSWHRSEI